MKIITVTDAWEPQVNGVVRTIQATNRELERGGHTVAVISPRDFVMVPCPGYSGIDLSLLPYRRLAKLLAVELAASGEIAIHVATEGPLGQAAARFCRRHRLPFTTAYHTRFPQYLHAMFGVPESWTYAFLRRFHRSATHVMAPTPSVERELRSAGIDNVAHWTRGVDTEAFSRWSLFHCRSRDPCFCASAAFRSRRTSRHFCGSTYRGLEWLRGSDRHLKR